ncbi:ANTAR domain-containing protein [Pseudarthrobacter sp. efr-133-R2A-89]|uniref:GAF and ANTAR domain-containing protein n=1 Tax=Pseudarthrobacter sp. efr-133-R2A-89 TaxID=3040302 RepID=UPI002553D297|nr:ANTAR domain-containing protein [Pseudarthrobacter sp. efr-133-R2A-89]
MNAPHPRTGFPARRARVASGAGDEELFETKGSPPAVAGPPTSRGPSGVAVTAPASPGPKGRRNPPLLLDLVSGAQTLADSLDLLVAASAGHVARTAGVEVGCGLVLHQPKRSPALSGTSEEVLRLLGWERGSAEGPVTDVLSGGHPVAVLQRTGDFRWRQYSGRLQSAGYGSALAVRLQLDAGIPAAEIRPAEADPGRLTAALAFFAPDAKAFPLQVIAEARGFAALAARSLRLAIDLHATRALATDLQSALDSRTSINVACGVIMAQNRCSYEEAFAILAKASSHRNIKVRKVAEGILERLPEGPPPPHFGN